MNGSSGGRPVVPALDIKPDFVIDDGGDLVHMLHTKRRELLSGIVGGSEETTTGVHRLRALANEGKLEFPMIAANDAYCKYLFDNRYGTGQSTWDGIMRTTNVVIAGKNVVIALGTNGPIAGYEKYEVRRALCSSTSDLTATSSGSMSTARSSHGSRRTTTTSRTWSRTIRT